MANYIKYGDIDVDQEAYLKKIADEADAYVESLPWSSKLKNRWRLAYSDIVSRGITGASIATEGQDAGRWLINYNGDSIPIESMNDKDRRAYGDAAYFLKTQMESLSTPKEEVKEDLPVFDNKTFTTGLNQLMTSKLFGGHSWTTQEDWNPKDERDSTGKRGTKNRAELLALQLELYRDSLKEGLYSFEGSPFENLEDFKNRINDAVTALRTEDPKDDLDALNKIGLKYRDFLYDGLDDTWGENNGTSISYAQHNQLLELLAAQAAAAAETTKPPVVEALELPTFKSIERSSFIHVPRNLLQLSAQFDGDLNQAKGYLLQLALKEGKMTWDDWSIALGMFNIHKNELENLTKDELDLFKSLERYKNLNPNRLKKIKGIDGIYLDTKTNLVIRPSLNELSELESAFFANKPKTELEFLNSEIPGLTSADKKDLWAIGLDIASILDPEAISGAALGTTAAGLRHSATNDIPGHKWGLWESIGQGLDYVTGVLGGIPVLGDAVLGAKTAANVTKAVTKLTPILRKMARAGAWKDIYDGLGPSTQAVWDKIVNGEDLTVSDWKDLGQLIRGLAGHRALNRGNLAERRVLEKSGYDVSGANSLAQRTGFARTRLGIPEEQITNTLKIKVDGKETEILLSDESIKELKDGLKKAGHNKTERDKVINNLKEVKEKYGPKEEVKEPSKEGKTKEEPKKGEESQKTEEPEHKVEAVEAGWRDYKYVPGFIRNNPVSSNNRSWIRKKYDWIKETREWDPHNLKNVTRGEDKFEEYLANRSNWDRIKYGTNRELRNVRGRLDMSYPAKMITPPKEEPQKQLEVKKVPQLEAKKDTPKKSNVVKRETPLTSEEAKALKEKVKNLRLEYKDIYRLHSNKGRKHLWSKNSVEANPESLKTSVKLGNKELNIEIASDGTLILNGERTSINGFGNKGLGKAAVRKKIKEVTQKMIKEQRLKRNTDEFEKLVQELRKLKSSGFLKQGGIIDNDNKLLNIIKDVNI